MPSSKPIRVPKLSREDKEATRLALQLTNIICAAHEVRDECLEVVPGVSLADYKKVMAELDKALIPTRSA